MTRLNTLMTQLELTVQDLCRAAKLYPPDAYQIRKGARSVGPRVRPRIAAALQVREEELFDADGWPLTAEA